MFWSKNKTEKVVSRVTKPNDMSIIAELITNFINSEINILSKTTSPTDFTKSAIYNIALFNLDDLEFVDDTFWANDKSATLVRLKQAYMMASISVGNAVLEDMKRNLIDSIFLIGSNKERMELIETTFSRHPYLIFVPIMNTIYVNRVIVSNNSIQMS